jgi:mannose-6-phosphate isomerase-like protein (cupin superfamily)/CDGSH-type Zn-finger protein
MRAMPRPVIARPKGYYYEVEAGKRYAWCACGLSKTQPFCDGTSHKATELKPVLFKAERDECVIFCGCKQTCTAPFCDGTHNNLEGGYACDDPYSEANRAIVAAPQGVGPVRRLDGQCFVFSPSRAEMSTRGGLRYCPVISPALGSLFQSQFYAEVSPGEAAPVIAADGRDVVLFVRSGEGEIEISGRRFPLRSLSGIYVRPAEAFRIENPGPEQVRLFISNGPGSEDLTFIDTMPTNFDATHPHRSAEIDPSQRHGMGDRFYQVLINREHGSDVITQFIGNISLSKGQPHRHLYEEALIFLRGAGVVWTETLKAEVEAGDVLFLPRKLLHSVQCTVESGLDVVGVIYPGDNPSINY